MTLTVPPRRRWFVSASAVLTTFAVLLCLVTPASAVPPEPTTTTPPNEGGGNTLDTLRNNLEAAAIGWLDAEAALATAKTEQVRYQEELTIAELDIARARVGVGKYAGEAYKTGPLTVLGAMLNATSPDDFLGRATAIDKITQRDQERLRLLREAKERATAAKKRIDEALAAQEAAVGEMAKRKSAAERALSAVGGGATRGWLDPNSRAATPAPRNSNGSWPRETCSINDPTTSGCITPRTNHAMKEAIKAGFTRYVSCYRPGDRWEHPLGRACDHSANKSGFVNSSAGGDDKIYGNNLAYFYVKNAIALGVMYVVWYCDIWHVGTGWRKYNSAGGNCGDSPAGDHTNHVHVSIY